MILRSARAGDEIELESFDLGSVSSPWLDEVREIVSGLVSWQRDREHAELDRQVVVAESDGAIVAVAAHERLESVVGGPLNDDRYIMVVAVRADQQRTGVAKVVTESVIVRLRSDGARTVRWLVPPAQHCVHRIQPRCVPGGRRDLSTRRPAVRAVRARSVAVCARGLSGDR